MARKLSHVEPVRVLWIVTVALGALLGAGGVTDVIPDRLLVILGLVLAVLTAVLGERARGKVTPLADPRDAQLRPLVADPRGR